MWGGKMPGINTFTRYCKWHVLRAQFGCFVLLEQIEWEISSM